MKKSTGVRERVVGWGVCGEAGDGRCQGVEPAAGFNPDSGFGEFLVLFTAVSLVPTMVPGTL